MEQALCLSTIAWVGVAGWLSMGIAVVAQAADVCDNRSSPSIVILEDWTVLASNGAAATKYEFVGANAPVIGFVSGLLLETSAVQNGRTNEHVLFHECNRTCSYPVSKEKLRETIAECPQETVLRNMFRTGLIYKYNDVLRTADNSVVLDLDDFSGSASVLNSLKKAADGIPVGEMFMLGDNYSVIGISRESGM